jgi:methylase of polypeptide subunit release factors
MPPISAHDLIWDEAGAKRRARFVSARGGPTPKRAIAVGDELSADAAFRLASQGTAIVWTGDYHNARQLLQALGRRIDKRRTAPDAANPAAAFNAFRLAQAQRAGILGLLLVPVTDGAVPLRRAPDLRIAIEEAVGRLEGDSIVPLRDVLAFVSAHEWRKNGVAIPALGGAKIHPHYGVFPPTRQDYIDLVATAPLPPGEIAFDLGTGSGILAAVLLHRGVKRVVATDNAPSAIACAADNFARLGLSDRVTLVEGDLYPDGKASLVACNPPWLPAKAGTSLESAVYDPDGSMLRAYIGGLRDHLLPGGEGWLILSDLAEHLGLRSRQDLLTRFATAGLTVLGRLEAPPSSKAARDKDDPLYFARSREVVSLWRLGSSA